MIPVRPSQNDTTSQSGVCNVYQTPSSSQSVSQNIPHSQPSTPNVNGLSSMFQQKTQEGHNPSNFISKVNEDLLCPLCSQVVRKPRECIVCGNMFCECCIKSWAERMNKINYFHSNPNTNKPGEGNAQYIITECPMKCKSNYNIKESIFKPVGKVVKNILYQLQIKCPNSTCGKVYFLDKYEEHEFYCFLPKCQNSICGKGTDKQIVYKPDESDDERRFCTDNCKFSYIFQENVTRNQGNKDEMALWFHNFLKQSLNENIHRDCEKRIGNLKAMVKAVSGKSSIVINDIEYCSGITNFKWDMNKKGQGIQVFNSGEGLLLHESCYAFRTIVGCTPFTSGVHYWEIIADRRTENELKIGVTRNINFNYDTSFSDYSFGWAFYGIGQLRHNNNATGEGYGKKFKKHGVLGVFLDMNRGILSFALDGEYFGISFQSKELQTGPIWPAISLLHIAGCSLQVGIPSPPYFFSDY
mmetsp:Transcript_5416/g.5546  ORF Transcript_5416/g.5546 Transcript_5416/m.5546 type:complete len:469 (+) Transcript_5416:10-1416(+)